MTDQAQVKSRYPERSGAVGGEPQSKEKQRRFHIKIKKKKMRLQSQVGAWERKSRPLTVEINTKRDGILRIASSV